MCCFDIVIMVASKYNRRYKRYSTAFHCVSVIATAYMWEWTKNTRIIASVNIESLINLVDIIVDTVEHERIYNDLQIKRLELLE